jgi:hypothetical protein
MTNAKEPERPDPDTVAKHDELVHSLFQELMQSERSAQLHCLREARRLGDSEPAQALRRCAAHARHVAEELRSTGRALRITKGRLGRTIGQLLSRVRASVIDRVIDQERSYRGTLAGLRHGVDVARMLQHAADASGQVEVAGFCTRWLDEREPLVQDVAKAMTWFALNPRVAVAHPA